MPSAFSSGISIFLFSLGLIAAASSVLYVIIHVLLVHGGVQTARALFVGTCCDCCGSGSGLHWLLLDALRWKI